MSTELGLTPEQVISVITSTRVIACCDVAALVVLLYDIVLTFPQEVASIWRRKLTGVTVLFAINRYAVLANLFLQTLTGFWMPRTIIGYVTVSILPDRWHLLGLAAFATLRVWAICGRRWFPTISVFLFSMFVPCVNIYGFSIPADMMLIESGPLTGCFIDVLNPPYRYTSAEILRESRRLNMKTELSSLLLRNGSVQFSVLLTLNLMTVIFDILSIATTSNTDEASAFVYISEALSSILISRFLLDLRAVYLPSTNKTLSLSNISSVHFASAVAGNIGASLDLSWTAAPEDALTEGEGEKAQFSSTPLAIGLLPSEPSVSWSGHEGDGNGGGHCSMIVNSPVGSPIGNDRPDTQPVADLSMHYGESIELKPRA
ncbi:unnamed protein product [Somion occarium]|uniref:DUF6533 domain-containing protein n=1 Tax=Somion occarium TaxID=3059160 RepID=A0ABP1CS70_9APHY